MLVLLSLVNIEDAAGEWAARRLPRSHGVAGGEWGVRQDAPYLPLRAGCGRSGALFREWLALLDTDKLRVAAGAGDRGHRLQRFRPNPTADGVRVHICHGCPDLPQL